MGFSFYTDIKFDYLFEDALLALVLE